MQLIKDHYYRPGCEYTRRDPDPVHLADPPVEAVRTKTTAVLVGRLFGENLDLPQPVDDSYHVDTGVLSFFVADATAVEQWAGRLGRHTRYTRTPRAPQVVRVSVEGVARIYAGTTDRYLPVVITAVVDDPGHVIATEVA